MSPIAENFPDEGTDYILGVIPKGATTPATLYLGLFTSQTATTVPAATAVLATGTGVTEATGSGYARQSIAAAAWAAASGASGTRRTLGPQVTFTATGALGPITGFFIATAGVALFYANFDDGTAVTLQNGDSLRVTPTWQLNA
ncbi:MAG: hypothetical protein LC798_19425 [Chloroflexi bacterium]|nr:hypothetical protein [Chloroflexota bacterium]